jgi:hypothetical protein
MTNRQAIKIIMKLIAARVQILAVEANMCDMYHATYSQAVAASKERKQLRELIDFLTQNPEISGEVR